MKAKFHSIAIACLLALASGCTGQVHTGIEAGNPDLSVKSIRAVSSAAVYDVTLIDGTTAVVIRNQSAPGGSETVSVSYRREGNTVSLEAPFSDGQNVGVETTFDETGSIESGVLTVDGDQVEACFELPGLSPACEVPTEPSDASALEGPVEDGTEEASAPYAIGDHAAKPDEGLPDSVSGVAENFDYPTLSGLQEEEEEPEPTSTFIAIPPKTAPALPQGRPLQLAR